jgi:phospholipid/cholesterol/gamma-HCH transport system substrate-binding protein
VSQHLVPRAGTTGGHALRMVALAAAAATLLCAAGAYLGLSYVGLVSGDTRVRAELVTLGDSLGPGSDVKYRGLVVGKVQRMNPGDGSKSVDLLVDREQAGRIPATVRARVLPGTLFGSEYVDLVGTQRDTGDALTDGTVVRADTSEHTVRLMDAFDTVRRILVAVDPAQLDAALSELAHALDGHGDDLGRFIRSADRFVGVMAAHEDTFYRDLELLDLTLGTASDIEPELVAALRSSVTTARTVVARQRDIAELVAGSTVFAGRSRTLFEREEDRVIRLLGATGPTLTTLSSGTDSLDAFLSGAPRVLHNGADSIHGSRIMMEGLIGTNPLDPYTAADCPRYAGASGSNCTGSDGRYDAYEPAGPRRTVADAPDLGGSAGPVGSEPEKRSVAVLFGLTGDDPGLRDVYTLLGAPILRGQEVTTR